MAYRIPPVTTFTVRLLMSATRFCVFLRFLFGSRFFFFFTLVVCDILYPTVRAQYLLFFDIKYAHTNSRSLVVCHYWVVTIFIPCVFRNEKRAMTACSVGILHKTTLQLHFCCSNHLNRKHRR